MFFYIWLHALTTLSLYLYHIFHAHRYILQRVQGIGLLLVWTRLIVFL